MNRKLKIKILNKKKNIFHVVVALNKKSVKSHYLEKLGSCFFVGNKKIVLLSLKRLSFWLNKGALMNNRVTQFFTIIFRYYLEKKNRKKIWDKLVFLQKYSDYKFKS